MSSIQPTQARPQGNGGRKKFTPVMTFHYVRLVYRSALFLAMVIAYILYRVGFREAGSVPFDGRHPVVVCFLIVRTIEMIQRLFPSGIESPGCQKQFVRNYVKSGETDIRIQDNNGTVIVLLVWIMFNMVFGVLHMAGWLDDGFMILLSCAYSVCDMICILFFCPFQSWFLKNKCCNVCRIYDWNYAMMLTPLIFVRDIRLQMLLAFSILLMLRWEITFYRYPERFSERTNIYLRCENCTEKLCMHKNQLASLWKKIDQYTKKRIQRLRKTDGEKETR